VARGVAAFLPGGSGGLTPREGTVVARET
jgi:hypothetical protein